MPDTSSDALPDPVQFLQGGFLAVLKEEMSIDDYLRSAGDRRLALAATPESVGAIIEFLNGHAEQLERAALLLAFAIESHASTLNTLGRNGLSLPLYEAIRPVFERHASPELLSTCYVHQGIVLTDLGRLAEAIGVYDQAIATCARLVQEEGRTELANDLATALVNKANALQSLGRLAEAIGVYDQAIATYTRLVQEEGRTELANDLAAALMNKANALCQFGRLAEAIGVYDQAIAIRAGLVQEEGRGELANDLARALMNKGVALEHLGRLAEAIGVYDQAIAIRARLVQEEGRTELANDLARALMNKANALEDLGRLAEAIGVYDQAIATYTRLVQEEGRTELANDLARALMNKGVALEHLGRLAEAIGVYDQAIATYTRLVQEEGRTELANDLARALMNKGVALEHLGRLAEAIGVYDQAIATCARLVQEEGRTELANDLAGALVNKANALQTLGRLAEAIGVYDQAIATCTRLVQEEGRTELANDLAAALMNKANALASLGRLAEAIGVYDQAIAIRARLVEEQRRGELANDLANAIYNKALTLEQLGNREQALAEYLRLDVSLFRGDDLRKYHYAVSDNLWQQGRREEALEHLFRAVDVYRQARRTAGLDETFLEFVGERSGFLDNAVCRSLEASRSHEAFACIQESKAGILTDLWGRLPVAAHAEPDEVQTARRHLVHWLRGRPEPANLQAWLDEQNRRTQEYLRTWRIAVADRGARGPHADSRPATLEEIRAALAPGWAVVDFWRTTNEEVTAFIVTRDAFDVTKLKFPVESEPGFGDKLTALQELMRDPVTCMDDGFANDTALDDLHAYLFAPLRPLLREKGITGLYLVPQGFLHALPLHAVRRTIKGERRYLCDDFAVAYLPSAALLPRLPALQPHGPLLSLANPERGTTNCLPFADWEGWKLSRRSGRFHRGPDATYAATDGWGSFGTLHFSCHGAGDRQFAPLSRLYLHDDLMLAHDVTNRRPALREGALVILNGCQTGVKDWRAADEGMGLMSAFLLRGASLVLSTMWSVVDGCAAEVVLGFVEELIDRGRPPVEALREAQKRVRAMTWQDYERQEAEVEKLFNAKDHPHEVGKLKAQRAWVSSRCGLPDEARASAEEAAPLLRRAGLEFEAERLLLLTRDGRGRTRTRLTLPFDHPLLWGAFQLVGRVTPDSPTPVQ